MDCSARACSSPRHGVEASAIKVGTGFLRAHCSSIQVEEAYKVINKLSLSVLNAAYSSRNGDESGFLTLVSAELVNARLLATYFRHIAKKHFVLSLFFNSACVCVCVCVCVKN